MSETPSKRYCHPSQKTDNMTLFSAASRLLTSTIAATAIDPDASASPNPILRSGWNIFAFWLPKIRMNCSYKGIEASMMMRGNTVNDWVGILKWCIVLFMMFPCCTVNVISWARQQFIRIVVANMGSRPRKVFVSSTSVAVTVLSINALSRILQINLYHLST